ncbi:MAG: hypothetical protein ABJK11_16225 [Balneola sp.]
MTINIKIENIFELIELIKKRPGLYIADSNITSIQNFIYGYDLACLVNNIEHKNVFPLFWYFHEWIKEKYNWSSSTAGWKNIILQENNNDEIKSLDVFFAQIEEFKKLHPISIEYIELTKENLEFNNSENCKMKTYNPKTKLFDLPIYTKADRVFLVEHSHDFGFSIFVNCKGKLVGNDWTRRFENSEKGKLYTNNLFGTNNNWKVIQGDLIQKINEIVRYSS